MNFLHAFQTGRNEFIIVAWAEGTFFMLHFPLLPLALFACPRILLYEAEEDNNLFVNGIPRLASFESNLVSTSREYHEETHNESKEANSSQSP